MPKKETYFKVHNICKTSSYKHTNIGYYYRLIYRCVTYSYLRICIALFQSTTEKYHIYNNKLEEKQSESEKIS